MKWNEISTNNNEVKKENETKQAQWNRVNNTESKMINTVQNLGYKLQKKKKDEN